MDELGDLGALAEFAEDQGCEVEARSRGMETCIVVGKVYACELSSDGSLLVTKAAEKGDLMSLSLWEVASGRELLSLGTYYFSSLLPFFTADDQHVAFGNWVRPVDGSSEIISFANQNPTATARSGDKQIVVVCYARPRLPQVVECYSLKTFSLLSSFQTPEVSSTSVGLNIDGTLGVLLTRPHLNVTHQLSVFRSDTGTVVASVELPTHVTSYRPVVFSPVSPGVLLLGEFSDRLYLVRINVAGASLELEAIADHHVMAKFTPTGLLAYATPGLLFQLHFWCPEAHRRILTVESQAISVRNPYFTPDGERFIVGDERHVRLVDTPTPAPDAHTHELALTNSMDLSSPSLSGVLCVAFSSNCCVAAVAHQDRRVRVWRIDRCLVKAAA